MKPYPTYTNKQINIPYLLKIGNGKTQKIGKYLFDKDMNNIALFTGYGIDELLGDKLYGGLEIQNIKILHKEIIDDISIEKITHTAFNLPPVIDAVVGIGGGKALDFAKYCAYLLKIPFISVPTSTSNDGFCSPSSSLTVDGKRKSVKSGIPYGVVIDLDIIKGCPKIFLYSGVGDMVSKITALWDWKEAFNKGFERFNDFASLLAYNSLDLLFNKHSFNVESPEFQRSLSNSLLVSGIAMEVAGTSRPASGSEHLISHALDSVCKKPKMHGIQVGVATYLCALLQKNENTEGVKTILSKTGFFEFAKGDTFAKKEFIEALKIASGIKQDYYTILSEVDSFERAVKFIETDGILKTIIK
ncbi:MAG: iron-containing alcohol dehydrogenase family protein [Lactobacillaceae bacterium]|jgi:glycerol-1-phosphate dehydrogenase [NAD(P)+]|nr:iron-containing alcohol dehydrogenase family protein [Lactobacillaceae bacterium]